MIKIVHCRRTYSSPLYIKSTTTISYLLDNLCSDFRIATVNNFATRNRMTASKVIYGSVASILIPQAEQSLSCIRFVFSILKQNSLLNCQPFLIHWLLVTPWLFLFPFLVFSFPLLF